MVQQVGQFDGQRQDGGMLFNLTFHQIKIFHPDGAAMAQLWVPALLVFGTSYFQPNSDFPIAAKPQDLCATSCSVSPDSTFGKSGLWNISSHAVICPRANSPVELTGSAQEGSRGRRSQGAILCQAFLGSHAGTGSGPLFLEYIRSSTLNCSVTFSFYLKTLSNLSVHSQSPVWELMWQYCSLQVNPEITAAGRHTWRELAFTNGKRKLCAKDFWERGKWR